jgi:hypothetical protein
LSRIHENEKQISFERYVQPFGYFNLSMLYVDNGRLDDALFCLNKAKSFKDYDHEDRLQLQIRTLSSRIEYKKSLI